MAHEKLEVDKAALIEGVPFGALRIRNAPNQGRAREVYQGYLALNSSLVFHEVSHPLFSKIQL